MLSDEIVERVKPRSLQCMKSLFCDFGESNQKRKSLTVEVQLIIKTLHIRFPHSKSKVR